MFSDGVMETSATLSTADYILAGAVYNSRTFAQAFADNNAVAYFVQTLTRSKWEMVIGTYVAGPPRKLVRSTVVYSSAGGAKVDWQPGDAYYIASIASADALTGVASWGHLNANKPWWVQFGQWVRQNFPSAGKHTWKLFDGVADIDLGVIDVATHKIQYAWAIPAGIVTPFAGTASPPNWLPCYGQQVSKATYPLLWTAIGTNWGPSDANNFSLPDMRSRYPLGVDLAGAGNGPAPNPTGRVTAINTGALAQTGGVQSVSATINITSTGKISSPGTPITTGPPSLSSNANTQNGSTAFSWSGHNHTLPETDISVSGSGGTGTMVTLPPSITLYYIISTGQT